MALGAFTTRLRCTSCLFALLLALVLPGRAVLDCWMGGYTQDMCCANGGWDNCFDVGQGYTYAACCPDTSLTKDAAHLASARESHLMTYDFLRSKGTGVGELQEWEGILNWNHAVNMAFLVRGLKRPGRLRRIVEVGVHQGDFAKIMMMTLYATGYTVDGYWGVDIWDPTYHPGADLIVVMTKLASFVPTFHAIQETSRNASRMFLDASMDFVFIDAMHTYEAVAEDLRFWWPMVAYGGILGGHDYRASEHRPDRFPGLYKAVQEFAREQGVFDLLIGVQGNCFALRKPAHDLQLAGRR